MTGYIFRIPGWAGVCLLILLMLPFVLHAFVSGVAGLAGATPSDSRFFAPGAGASNPAVFAHMITGGLLTVLVPLQLVTGLRQRWPGLHRASGRLLIGCALATGAGGLVYIALRGTIGGWPMNAGFALYGGLLIMAALMTLSHARAGRFGAHRRWALRLFVLAIGSWLYRVHYTVWHLLGFEAGIATGFRSPFDLIQNFAFYLPYLLLLELWLRARKGAAHQAISTQTSR